MRKQADLLQPKQNLSNSPSKPHWKSCWTRTLVFWYPHSILEGFCINAVRGTTKNNDFVRKLMFLGTLTAFEQKPSKMVWGSQKNPKTYENYRFSCEGPKQLKKTHPKLLGLWERFSHTPNNFWFFELFGTLTGKQIIWICVFGFCWDPHSILEGCCSNAEGPKKNNDFIRK